MSFLTHSAYKSLSIINFKVTKAKREDFHLDLRLNIFKVDDDKLFAIN